MGVPEATTHKVNLGLDGSTPRCDCGNFRLKGIPCEEACALIHRLGHMPGEFIRDSLKVSAGLQVTEHALQGFNMPNIVKSELVVSNAKVLPPLLQPPAGRPPKKRKTKESVRRAFLRFKTRKERQKCKSQKSNRSQNCESDDTVKKKSSAH